MLLFVIFRTWMGQLTLLSGMLAITIPFVLYQLKRQMCRNGNYNDTIFLLLLFLCVTIIIYITVIRRTPTVQAAIPPPFWSYREFYKADVRWQVYMNSFMFVPFGFLIALALRKNFVQTLLIGMLFSILIEVIQYFSGRGFSEFDDVLSNTIGAVIGYAYWKILQRWLTER